MSEPQHRSPSATEQIVLEPTVKASLATLIAHLLLHEVDGQTLELLSQPEMLEVLEKLEPGCRDYLTGSEWSPQDFEMAAVEYCRLFVLPNGVPPYANAWLSGDPLVNGPRIAVQIGETMSRLGITEVDDNQPRDHLGVLLMLTARAWELASESEPEAEPGEEPLARILYRDLLTPWVPAFCEALSRRTENPLYRAVGGLLGQLIRFLP